LLCFNGGDTSRPVSGHRLSPPLKQCKGLGKGVGSRTGMPQGRAIVRLAAPESAVGSAGFPATEW